MLSMYGGYDVIWTRYKVQDARYKVVILSAGELSNGVDYSSSNLISLQMTHFPKRILIHE